MNKLRVVLVGCGGMSAAWLKVAAERSDVDVVGLVDVREEAAASRREEFHLSGAAIGTELKKLLSEQKPDVVFDVTVPESHVSVTLTALEHGCHVMGEKPLADSLENAYRMIRAARAADRLYAVMQNRRYNLPIRGFRSLLESEAIGKLTTLNSDFYIGAHFGGFRAQMEHVLLLDMAIHSFDQARFISGADPVSVYCHEWNPGGSWFDHEASAVCIFEMTGGIIYTYRGSWCAEGLNTSWECDWRAVGTSGSATWDGGNGFRAQSVKETGSFHSEMKDVPVTLPSDGKSGGHSGAIHEFLDCVRNGGTPETICTDNVKSLAMVFGAVESALTRSRVGIQVPQF